MATNQIFDSIFNANSSITEDWSGGYKFELSLTAESNAEDWQVNLNLPYAIKAAYGVDLVDNGNGNYTISGQNDQASLYQGQSIKPIFVIDDYSQEAVLPQLDSSMTTSFQPTSEIVPEMVGPTPESSGTFKTINVDSDFGGDLKSAIASANNGDVIQLGSNRYYTSGVSVDKDITIQGQEGSVIDGGGSSEAIIYLNSGATGATIQNVEITNANNGIFGDGAGNLTLQNLNVNNIGVNQTIRGGQNNTGIILGHANGLQLLDSTINNIGRSGINVGDTEGAVISGITVQNVNLAAEHVQSHDAAGIKFFNTNNTTLKNSYLSDINAYHIWNDTTTGTVIEGNTIDKIGEDFRAPYFNPNVEVTGIYNEKSHNSVVKNNIGNANEGFTAFRATEFTTETMILEDNNSFSSVQLGTTDYWVNEEIEKRIAITENPDEANFSLFANEYNAQANIG